MISRAYFQFHSCQDPLQVTTLQACLWRLQLNIDITKTLTACYQAPKSAIMHFSHHLIPPCRASPSTWQLSSGSPQPINTRITTLLSAAIRVVGFQPLRGLLLPLGPQSDQYSSILRCPHHRTPSICTTILSGELPYNLGASAYAAVEDHGVNKRE